MQKSAIVTLIDRGHVERAKQLFSSLYCNAKWQGDCVLLHYNVLRSNINWFKKHGIVTLFSPPLYSKPISRYAPVVSSKLRLFDIRMKKWKNIIYLDTDVIVKSSIARLSTVKNFSAVPEKGHLPLRAQIIDKPTNISEYIKLMELKILFNLNDVAFNAGVLAFPTSIITLNTLKELISLVKKYASICKYSDQGIQNLYFYRRWRSLPEEYNMFPKYSSDILNIKPQKNIGKILHFADEGEENKPWHSKNYFYREWQYNLKKAEQISLTRNRR